MKTLSILSALCVAVLLGSCGDPGTQPDDELAPGTYEATLTGDQSLTLKANAGAIQVSNTMAIILAKHPITGLGEDTIISIYIYDIPALTLGTHQVGDWNLGTDAAAQFYFGDANRIPYGMHRSKANAGTVTLTRITDQEIAGEFSFDVTRSNEEFPTVLHAAGRFRATCVVVGCTVAP